MNTSNIIEFPTARSERTGTRIGAASGKILRSKDSRRNGGGATSSASVASSVRETLLASEIWDALNDGRIELHYQPQYNMQTGMTVAAEALIRLVDQEGLLVYPDRFINVAEESDLIAPLGRAVIEQVCCDLAACRTDDITVVRIAMNLSAQQLNLDAKLVEFIDGRVASYGLTYGDLEFELTERQVLAPSCAGISVLNTLAERGARIVIDDFGTGFSSVLYLTKLPISAFKLDRAFVSRLPEDRAMRSVVKNLLTMAEELELEVIAEGVETLEQNAYLASAGCPFAQGFGFAKPMAIDAFRTFLTDHPPSPSSVGLRA